MKEKNSLTLQTRKKEIEKDAVRLGDLPRPSDSLVRVRV